ncbi:MAG: threonine synthase [Candidatus Magnetoovum sp. WYHC-5]|nr:threonine synthase [Candidatus Magnetoovum sp. WYHC-5]
MDLSKLKRLLPKHSNDTKKFFSTRDCGTRKRIFNWKEVLDMGLAPDSGLFLPCAYPQIEADKLEDISALNYAHMAWILLRGYLPQEDIDDEALLTICTDAYKDITIPLENAPEENIVIAWLDRGPTASFKDFAALFLARLMSYYLSNVHEEKIIIVATSGDTGTAIQRAFYKVPNTYVLVLYPAAGVSVIQEKQMLSISNNVRAVPVNGNFDDCQRLAKSLLNSKHVRKQFNLTSANSISIWRLLPQLVYYFYVWSRCIKTYPHTPISVSVPSGNLGNLTAGLIAKHMGLPLDMLISATNANNIFANVVGKGTCIGSLSYRKTPASAMDIAVPSNLERILSFYGEAPENIPLVLSSKKDIADSVMERLQKDIFAEDVITEEDIEGHILRFWNKYGITIEPHGAIGVAACYRFRQYFSKNDSIIVVLETAAPAKFYNFIEHSSKKIPIPTCQVINDIIDIDLDKVRPNTIEANEDSVIEELKKLK